MQSTAPQLGAVRPGSPAVHMRLLLSLQPPLGKVVRGTLLGDGLPAELWVFEGTCDMQGDGLPDSMWRKLGSLGLWPTAG